MRYFQAVVVSVFVCNQVAVHAAAETASIEQSIAAGKFQQAGIEWRQLVAKKPDRADLRLRYARFLRSTGQLEPAITEYEKAVAIDPKLSDAWLALSQIALQSFDVEQALTAAQNAIKYHKDSIEGRTLMISALMQSGRWPEADKELKALLLLQPKNAAVVHLAYQMQLRKGDFAQARTYLQTAVNLKPERSDWMLDLCKLLENGGDYQLARGDLKTILQNRPNDLEARLRLARNLEVFEHDFDGAIAEYKRALETEPDCAPAMAGIERCQVKKNNIALRLKLSLQSLFKR